MLHDLGSFVGNVLLTFWAIISGVVLTAEPAAKFFWHGYDTWAARYLAADHRKRLARSAAVGTLIVANFLAYHSTQDDIRVAKTQIASLKSIDPKLSDSVSIDAAGTTQDTATPISAPYNVIVSVTPTGGVVLRPRGQTPITVKNTAPSNVRVYPPVGAKFDGFFVDEPVAIFQNSGTNTFVCISKTRCMP